MDKSQLFKMLGSAGVGSLLGGIGNQFANRQQSQPNQQQVNQLGYQPQGYQPQGGQPQAGQQSDGFMQSLLFGKQGQQTQQSTVTPEQKQILDMMLQQGGQNTDFRNIEQQARTGFEQQTIPSLAERFTSMGGGQSSSAFTNALGQAGAGLEGQLAGLKSQYGMQQLGIGMQPQFQPQYMQGQPGMAQGLTQAISQLLPLLMFL